MNEEIPKKQTVKRRLVVYIPGFDPMPPNRYRELYRAESQKQADICGFEIETKRITSHEGVGRFEVNAQFGKEKVHSEFRFMQWNDLVHNEMQDSIWRAWGNMWKIAKTVAFSGALSRLLKLHFPPNIAGLYPFIMIPLQIFLSIFMAIALVTPIGRIDAPWAMPLAWILGIAIAWSLILLWRRIDNRLMPYYLLHDLSFTCEKDGYTPEALRERVEFFKTNLRAACRENFDEILVVGHSSGAHIGAIMLAELIRDKAIKKSDHVSFLTLGHAVPLVAYLPGACDLRLALYELAQQDIIKWVDITSPTDGACFSLHDPIRSSVEIEGDFDQPRVLSAAFRQTLSEKYFRSLRLRFFRIHFQYLCHFDRPGVYDYFRVTAGPIRLWERFGEMSNTPSLLSGNFNKYTDRAP